jgi:hypothetical protein
MHLHGNTSNGNGCGKQDATIFLCDGDWKERYQFVTVMKYVK